jgi:hypothetical protein
MMGWPYQDGTFQIQLRNDVVTREQDLAARPEFTTVRRGLRRRDPSTLCRDPIFGLAVPGSGRCGSGSDHGGPEPRQFEHGGLEAMPMNSTIPR